MEVNCKHQALAVLPCGKTLNTFGHDAGWATEPGWTLWRRENCLFLPGTETRFVGRPFHCLVNALNEISWLFCVFKFAGSTI